MTSKRVGARPTARIALIPLDDRPCNFKFPQQIMAMAGETLIVPPKTLLGRFLRPGNPEKLLMWAERMAPRLEALVVSVDMIAYGGLVASRDPRIILAQAQKRLARVNNLKKRNPSLKIYLFNTIMRLSITAKSEKDRGDWAAVFRYSQIEDPDERKRAASKISPKVLNAYLAARRRNHEVNKLAISLIKEGAADFLVFGREDVAPSGLHRAEEAELRKLAGWAKLAGHSTFSHKGRSPIARKIFFMNGTDEIGQMLPVKYLVDVRGITPRVRVVYSSQRGKNVISLYEDVPLSRAVADHLELLKVRMTSSKATADFTLFIHTPDGPQRDLYLEPRKSGIRPSPHSLAAARLVSRELASGRPVSIADTAFANGGDWDFIQGWLPRASTRLPLLYSAWNTSSNAIGTAVAGGCASFTAGVQTRRSEGARLNFLSDRLMDDGYYQGFGRQGSRTLGPKKWLENGPPSSWRDWHAHDSLQWTHPWGRSFEIA